jgi:four helix bundle protein
MYLASFKELIVWQKAVDLAKEIYRTLQKMPSSETFGIRSQMQRAAVSIPSNIAEGKKRGTRKDFMQFLRIADGSAAELETQVLIAESVYPQLDFIKTKQLLEEVQKMLAVMLKRLGMNEQLSAKSSKL